MNWLDEIVEQHKELESPESFWRWSALAAISAVVRDNIWMDRQIFNTYPNIYVMLHAESGLKKGPPINMAKQLVTPVRNTKIITGRASIQGILKKLGTTQSAPGGKVELHSVAFICSSELTSSIVDDPVATKILTDLYDRNYNAGDWESLLKMETFALKNPTVAMLTATNEAMSEDFFTRSAIQGGYFARTFIIYEQTSQNVNSLTYPLDFAPNYAKSSAYLLELSKLTGPFKPFAMKEQTCEYRFPKVKRAGDKIRTVYFNATGIIYDDWYEQFKVQVAEQEIKDETGTLNRFGDSVLKVAMLMALAEKPELIITEEVMEKAIKECSKLVSNMKRATIGKTAMSSGAIFKGMLIQELVNRDSHQITRQVLMRKMWMHYQGQEEFDQWMAALHESGLVKTTVMGDQYVYYMPDDQVKEIREYNANKGKKK